MKHGSAKFFKIVMMFVLMFSMPLLGSTDISAKTIDTSRDDLGILDSLKLTNRFGDEVGQGSNIHNGETYTLMYKFSLAEPTSDYKNQVASFDIPDIFKSDSLNPAPMKLMYTDELGSYEIGSVTANLATGKITVQFNNSNILGTKSNINGWISLTAIADSTTGKHDVEVEWNGSDKVSIEVNVDNGIVGTNRVAELNKYINATPQPNGQPTVLQKEDGRFYISFIVEVMISKEYESLTVKDEIYAGLKIDESTMKVFSRPKDGQEYYSAPDELYKARYNAWVLSNPTGPKAVNQEIQTTLENEGKIVTSADGFEINFTDIDFDNELVSRQLTTTPLQMRYAISYDSILTNIDPAFSLSEAQEEFESQNARNDVKLITTTTVERETSWIKAALGGGATGEVRNVTLSKVDSETNQELVGAKFNLYKQNPYNNDLWELYKANITMVTGSILVEDLVFGNYRFEETVAPEGYELPSTPFDAFTINSATSQTNFGITLENTKAPEIIEVGGVAFEKVDSENSATKLSATFEIRKKMTDEVVTTVITDNTGKGEANDLEVGDYYLVETIAPIGYELDSTHYDFTVEKDVVNTIYFGANAITNAKTPELVALGGVVFEKVDAEDSSLKLSATFEIHKKTTDELITTVTTDNMGKGEASELEVGDYYLVETVAPIGYELDSTHYDFTIEKNSTNSIFIGDNAITNTKVEVLSDLGAIEFEKVDAADNTLKLSATFEIYTKVNDVLVTSVTTDNAGKALVTDLEIGDYYLVETVAPAGYDLDSTHYDFTIEKDSTNKLYIGDNAIKNKKAERLGAFGAIEFEKVDAADSTLKLSATFEIHKKETDELITTVTTDNGGKCLIDELGLGDYYLVETVAPVGYVLDSTHYNFTIEKDITNKIYIGDKAITNKKENPIVPETPSEKEPKLPETGETNNLVVITLLLGIGTLLFTTGIKRKRYENQ